MDTYNICYSTDGNYAEQLTVSIASVLKNAEKKEKFNFFILDGGLTDKQKSTIEKLKEIKNFTIKYIEVNPNDFFTCPLLKNKSEEYSNYHVTLPTYFRFKLCDYLKDTDKVLYLDCDVIVRKSLKELFEEDIENYSALMIKDAESEKESQRLGLNAYYNAGVMMVNLKFWYQNNIPTLLFDCAAQRTEEILWQDQDIINMVINESIKEMPSTWNYQYFLYGQENIEELSECAILHFAGKYKPWLRPFEHVVYDIYYKYLFLTEYKNKEIIYRREAFGKFLTPSFENKDIVVGEIASGFDIQSVNNEISRSYSKIDAIGDALEKCYRYTEQKISEYASQAENRVNDAINKIYEDINKNYKYTESQDAEYDERMAKNVDFKINETLGSINKNAAFLEAYILESVSKLEYDTENKIKKIIEEVTVNTDNSANEKIDRVYEEITKNYEFTKEITAKNREDALSQAAIYSDKIKSDAIAAANEFTLQNKNENQSYTDSKITELSTKILKLSNEINELPIPDIDMSQIDKLKNEYDVFCSKLREIPVSISSETDKKLDEVYSEIRKTTEYLKSRINEALAASASEFSQNNDKIRDEIRNCITDIRSKTDTEFIKIETQTNLKLSEIQNTVSINHSSLLDNISRLKTELSQYADNGLSKASERNTAEISRINEKLNEINQNIYVEADKISQNIALFKEIYDKSVQDLNDAVNNARLYTDYKINGVNELIENKQSETTDYINECINEANAFTEQTRRDLFEKVDGVENILNIAEKNLSEKIYSLAVDTSKKSDELCKYFENKLISDIQKLTYASNEKAKLLSCELTAKIAEKAEDITSRQKKEAGEIYEFASNNLKEIYETFTSANGGLKENFETKLSDLSDYVEEIKSKTENISAITEQKADITFVESNTEFLKKIISDMQNVFDEKLSVAEKRFEEKLNEQRIKYEQKIIGLENKLLLLGNKNSEDKSSKNSGIKNIFNKIKRVK